MSIIDVKNLSKDFKVKIKEKGLKGSLKAFIKPKYKIIKAVKNISFEVEEGEMIAFIGPNGAGKSTTIKMMTGILYPGEGEIRVLGIDPTKQRKKLAYEIGTVFGQKEQLWTHLTAYDNFKFFGAVYDIPDEVLDKKIDELIKLFELEKFINTPVRNLSLGQRIRCEIVASLIHEPKVLFLDEPTIGLDSTSKIAVREFIKKINKEKNTTIILTTHDTGDIEALTKRIILIGKGQLLLDGSLNSLMKRYSKKELNIKYKGKITELPLGMRLLEKNQNEAKIEVDEHQMKLADAIVFLSNIVEVQDLDVSNTPIDDVVANLYREYRI